MDEIDAFLAAIAAAPADPLPRLAYADWLDEHGEPEYAELIRISDDLERRIQHPGERKRLRQRRHELRQELLAKWSDPKGATAPISWFDCGSQFRAIASLSVEDLLAGWQKWPLVMRPRGLDLHDATGHEEAVAECPILARVSEL